MKRTVDELIAAFSTGETPKGEEFAALINAAYNVPDIEIYDSNGRVEAPFKCKIGRTTVHTNEGDFTIDYSNVGFSEVLLLLASPLHELVVTNNTNYIMSATIKSSDLTTATGKAFKSGDGQDPGSDNYRNAFGKIGDIIQYMIVGR